MEPGEPQDDDDLEIVLHDRPPGGDDGSTVQMPAGWPNQAAAGQAEQAAAQPPVAAGPSRRLVLGIAAGVVAVLLVGAGVLVATRSSDPTTHDAGHGVRVVADLEGTVEATPADTTLPFGLKPATGVFDVVLDGDLVSDTATVELPLRGEVPEHAVLVGAVARAADDWTLVDQPLEMEDGRARIPTSELSAFQAFWLPAEALVDLADELLDELSGGVPGEAPAPACSGEDEARADGYTAAADDGTTVPWCLGAEDGQAVLQVVNDRLYSRSLGYVGAQLAASDVEDLDRLAQLGSSELGERTLVGPGGTATFVVERAPGDDPAEVQIVLDGTTEAIFQLEVGAHVALSALALMGSEPDTPVVGLMDRLLATGGCADVVEDGDATAVLDRCFATDALVEAVGPLGALLAPVLAEPPVVEHFVADVSDTEAELAERDAFEVVVERSEAPAALPTDLSGTNYGELRGYDAVTRTFTVDVVQYLADRELFEHLAADPSRWDQLGCDLPDGTHQTYDGQISLDLCQTYGQPQMIINDNPQLRDLTVSPTARILVPGDDGSGASVPGTHDDLARAVGADLGTLYRFEVDGNGVVTSLEFVFFS